MRCRLFAIARGDGNCNRGVGGSGQLHDLNILHLDVKPGNVLLDDYGHAYLADFGISRTLRTLESCIVLTQASSQVQCCGLSKVCFRVS